LAPSYFGDEINMKPSDPDQAAADGARGTASVGGATGSCARTDAAMRKHIHIPKAIFITVNRL
jgi:hypothetical protein